MSHDAKREDYLRLSLRFACSLSEQNPAQAARAFNSFGRRYAQNRDSLPQTDADRAFHLVVLATDIIDNQLPFASNEAAKQLISRGQELLDEALSLDPLCYDALRMKSSSEAPTAEARYQFLKDRAETVGKTCAAAREDALLSLSDERAELAAELTMRPYYRWLFSLAQEALICGHNHAARNAAEKLLALDPNDSSDVRFTLAFTLAKLEDEDGLNELIAHYPTPAMRKPDDAWIRLAKLALAHTRCDFASAQQELLGLFDTYPHAATILISQVELPEGEFSRLRVAPYSQDELILAVSEAVVLFQEGEDPSGRGVLGAWIIREASKLDPQAALEVARALQEGIKRL